jgi:hypothetical protein
MKHLRYFKESKEDIHSICEKYNIRNYTINEDGSIDVDGNVPLNKRGLIELPIKFRNILSQGNQTGNFLCHDNKLTSLSGAPREVGGAFYCCENHLTSLEGSPNKVGGDFLCYFNKLTSLEGSPHSVGGDFYCYRNQLTSLEGISKYISGYINCRNNQLRDVKGVKEGWRGHFWIEGNPVHEIFKLFPEKRWDEVIEYLNEYDVIRDGKVVILQRLEQVFIEMGLEVPEIDEIEGYEIQF